MMGPGGPITATCALCGRGFGTTSINIHMKQCLKKRAAAQQQVLASVRARRWWHKWSRSCVGCFQLDASVRTAPATPPDMPVPDKADYPDREAFRAYVQGGMGAIACHVTTTVNSLVPVPSMHTTRLHRPRSMPRSRSAHVVGT